MNRFFTYLGVLFLLPNFSLYSKPKSKNEIFFDALDQGLSRKTKRMIVAGMSPDVKNSNGASALYWAIEAEEIRVVRVLMAAKADPNAGFDKRRLPLNACIEARIKNFSSAAIDILLKAGADPLFKNEEGLSSLDIAWSLGHFDLYAKMRMKGFDDPNRPKDFVTNFKKQVDELEGTIQQQKIEIEQLKERLVETQKAHSNIFFKAEEGTL